MEKITRATIKKFIKDNQKGLYIKTLSDFNAMTDCVESIKMNFRKIDNNINIDKKNDFGIRGVWLVGSGGDSFEEYSDDYMIGYKIYNCCGSFILAFKRQIQ